MEQAADVVQVLVVDDQAPFRAAARVRSSPESRDSSWQAKRRRVRRRSNWSTRCDPMSC